MEVNSPNLKPFPWLSLHKRWLTAIGKETIAVMGLHQSQGPQFTPVSAEIWPSFLPKPTQLSILPEKINEYMHLLGGLSAVD